MTFYEKEVRRIRDAIYANQRQLETVIKIRNYIETNLENEINLDQLSYIMHVSKYHMLRLFKKYYGQTPRQYLMDKRIKASKEKLKHGMTVTETCFAVGFESLGSFSVLFKNRTGKTPSQFRKEQLSRSN